jgi:hypothetical protein
MTRFLFVVCQLYLGAPFSSVQTLKEKASTVLSVPAEKRDEDQVCFSHTLAPFPPRHRPVTGCPVLYFCATRRTCLRRRFAGSTWTSCRRSPKPSDATR